MWEFTGARLLSSGCLNALSGLTEDEMDCGVVPEHPIGSPGPDKVESQLFHSKSDALVECQLQ